MRKPRRFCLFLCAVTAGFLTAGPVSAGYQYDDHGQRDPFWPLITRNGTILNYDHDLTVSDMNLQGIMADARGEAIAIINGMIVKKGDLIGLFEVRMISDTKVQLKKGEETIHLTLPKEE
ncbi:MAG: hypothetical protein ACLFPX_00520 [Candidatus Omnitrophota bacterium]